MERSDSPLIGLVSKKDHIDENKNLFGFVDTTLSKEKIPDTGKLSFQNFMEESEQNESTFQGSDFKLTPAISEEVSQKGEL